MALHVGAGRRAPVARNEPFPREVARKERNPGGLRGSRRGLRSSLKATLLLTCSPFLRVRDHLESGALVLRANVSMAAQARRHRS
jgi:hypothetical protein